MELEAWHRHDSQVTGHLCTYVPFQDSYCFAIRSDVVIHNAALTAFYC